MGAAAGGVRHGPLDGRPRAVALALEGLAAALALSDAGEPAGRSAGRRRHPAPRPEPRCPPAERGDVDRATAQARELLEREAFETAFRRGEELGPHEAMGVAVASGRASSTRVGP